jgi:D-glycero-D-manno-heptose 1,7-bisphosphate phosphatase
MKQRALFLDRDGVINRDTGYVFRKDQVQFVEGIFSLCRTAKRLGYRLVVVSHQKGLARGVFTEADYGALMEWIREEFRREGVVFDGVYHCPCGTKNLTPQSKPEQAGHKPGAGMLRRAARDLNLELSESVMVGDRGIDVAVANAGGLRQAFLLRGSEQLASGGAYTAVNSLGEVEAWLVKYGKGANLPPASQNLASLIRARILLTTNRKARIVEGGLRYSWLGCDSMKPAIWFQKTQPPTAP